MAEYIQHKQYYLQLGSQVQQKRDYFQVLMEQTRFRAIPTFGSYFQLFSYKEISDLKERDFSIWLTREHGVATIPLSAFYINPKENQTVRYCFVKKESTLEEAVNRLVKMG